MLAEILATGDEIRSGVLIDSNSAHIAQKLEEAGIKVVRHICVGDDMDIMISTLKEISSRADFALVTGGLGPTIDDITAEAAAKAAGVDLVLNNKALENIEFFFKNRRRLMTSSNKKQAMLPENSEILYNHAGTAPGFHLKINRCSFFFMPGVPFEMKKMLSEAVIPAIRNICGKKQEFCMVKTISTFGITESAAGEKLASIKSVFPDLKIGFRAKFPEIQVKIYLYGKDEKILHQRMDEACKWILEKIGDKTFSVQNKSMEAEVAELLLKQKSTIAVAESCTGGLISHLLTNIPGSSEYFLFSGISYSNESKIKVLNVSPGTLEKNGAVDEKTAQEMAEGVRRIAGADYGLSTSGIAGPSGGTDKKPVGTLCVGIATPSGSKGFRFNSIFHKRSMNKIVFAMKALDLLRRELLS
jgi:nicotinamide-nucleotide amidase